jgi:hypothetical protein
LPGDRLDAEFFHLAVGQSTLSPSCRFQPPFPGG